MRGEPMISFSVMDILTEAELDRAGEIHAESDAETFTRRCAEEIVAPALPRIYEATGERNDPAAVADKVRRTLAFVMGPGGFVPGLQ